jgi:hypothetical protein
MNAVIAWAAANPELAILVGAILADVLAGWLPDRYTKWPGLVLNTARKMYYTGKTEAPPEAKLTEDLVQRVIRRELSRYAKPKAS